MEKLLRLDSIGKCRPPFSNYFTNFFCRLHLSYALYAFYASDEFKNVKEYQDNGISSIAKLIKTCLNL